MNENQIFYDGKPFLIGDDDLVYFPVRSIQQLLTGNKTKIELDSESHMIKERLSAFDFAYTLRSEFWQGRIRESIKNYHP